MNSIEISRPNKRVSWVWQGGVVTERWGVKLLESEDLFRKLGMETASIPLDAEVQQTPWVQEEFALTRMVFTLISNVAAARSWSQAMFGIQLPQLCAGMLHENPDAKQGACNLMAVISRAILAAEKKADENKPLNSCMEDMAWHKLQLARELMKIGEVS